MVASAIDIFKAEKTFIWARLTAPSAMIKRNLLILLFFTIGSLLGNVIYGFGI